jgi:hypothetical protein
MASRPNPQELYRHFKGNLYQVLTIATNSETREEMVVYQALYGDYKVYVRPLDMFMSEVDHAKYPDVSQKMRFEKVSREDISSGTVAPDKSDVPEGKAAVSKAPERESGCQDKTPEKKSLFNFDKRPPEKSTVMSKSVDEEAKELNLDPLVIQFMDADLAVDKNDILSKLRPVITNDMIDIMALSLGVVVNEGDVYDRYNDLRTCLTTMEKYESTRLRS